MCATDFLPSGPKQEGEQLYRGEESESASESDERDSNDSDGGVSWNQFSEEDSDVSEDESVSRDDSGSEVSSIDLVRRRTDFDVSD